MTLIILSKWKIINNYYLKLFPSGFDWSVLQFSEMWNHFNIHFDLSAFDGNQETLLCYSIQPVPDFSEIIKGFQKWALRKTEKKKVSALHNYQYESLHTRSNMRSFFVRLTRHDGSHVIFFMNAKFMFSLSLDLTSFQFSTSTVKCHSLKHLSIFDEMRLIPVGFARFRNLWNKPTFWSNISLKSCTCYYIPLNERLLENVCISTNFHCDLFESSLENSNILEHCLDRYRWK